MLNKVKTALRHSSDALDGEIQDTIDACYRDMTRVGIAIYDENNNVKESIKTDALIVSCQKQYARWQFNFENAAERYKNAYESMRDGMSLSGDYNV